MWNRIALCIFAVAFVLACKTPDGPRLPLSDQDVSSPIPDDSVRVVFFNASNHALYFESGPIRIQLNGQQVPSIWLDHYVQVFVPPRTYELLLEHYDVVTWKSRYDIVLEGPEVFLKVYNRPTSTKFEQVDELPHDFHTRYKPGRDPENW